MSCNLFSIPKMISFSSISFRILSLPIFPSPVFLVLVPTAWPYYPPNSCIISFSLPSIAAITSLHFFYSSYNQIIFFYLVAIFLCHLFFLCKVFLHSICFSFHHTETGFIPSHNSFPKELNSFKLLSRSSQNRGDRPRYLPRCFFFFFFSMAEGSLFCFLKVLHL